MCNYSRKSGLAVWKWMAQWRHWRSVAMARKCTPSEVCMRLMIAVMLTACGYTLFRCSFEFPYKWSLFLTGFIVSIVLARVAAMVYCLFCCRWRRGLRVGHDNERLYSPLYWRRLLSWHRHHCLSRQQIHRRGVRLILRWYLHFVTVAHTIMYCITVTRWVGKMRVNNIEHVVL